MDDERTTVLIVDDHALLREGLRNILNMQQDMCVIGEAADSASAAEITAQKKPDIVLLDIQIPGCEAADTVSRIRRDSPESQVIILSMHESPQLVRALVAAGIRGYLLKSVHWQELVMTIRVVHDDANRIILGVSKESLEHAGQPSSPAKLSARELEVMELVAKAMSNSQIASRLNLTEATVKRHLRNIFAKLEAVSRLDAVNKATEQWLLSPRAPRR